jgi:hypothetical protein
MANDTGEKNFIFSRCYDFWIFFKCIDLDNETGTADQRNLFAFGISTFFGGLVIVIYIIIENIID